MMRYLEEGFVARSRVEEVRLEVSKGVPGLPIRDYAESHNNCVPRRPKLSAITVVVVTVKDFLEHLYLVLGLSP